MAEDPGAIREAIEETRAELADTIEALGEKADVKGRATDKVNEGKEQVRAKAAELGHRAEQALPDQARPAFETATQKAQVASSSASVAAKRSPGLAVAAAAAVVVLLALRRRRRKAS